MPCPNSTAGGCRCPDHHPGLLGEYGSAAAAPPPAQLSVVPAATPAEICHGYAHGCTCSQCTLRSEHGVTTLRPVRPRQPWEPRPARHRKAA